jgi:hypothetical protein
VIRERGRSPEGVIAGLGGRHRRGRRGRSYERRGLSAR